MKFFIFIVIYLPMLELSYAESKTTCPDIPELVYPCECGPDLDGGTLLKCENVNLAILSVTLENVVALNTTMDNFVINSGRFVRLFGPIFSNVSTIRMTIDDTPIRTIEINSFHGINDTLQHLFILHSNLTSFPTAAFDNLGKVTHLTIDGHLIETIEKTQFVPQNISKRVEVFRLTNGPLKQVPSEIIQQFKKLKTLDLHGNQLDTLKPNQFKNLRSVEVLDISYNRIKKLEAPHIADLTNLGWCNVSHNSITELPRSTFARNTLLKVLDLSSNSLSRLDANTFRGMRFLRRLFLSDNKISYIARGTFNSLSKIGTIDIARNQLQKVDFQMFSQLNYLEIVNLAENNITHIEKNAFKSVYQAIINISHNAIEIIEPLAFENCVNISVLDLSHNRIKNFSKNAFDETTFATEFQLSYNLLNDTADIPLQTMVGLKVLNASHNHIAQIPKNSFPKLYELHTVDFSFNNISFISNGVFQNLLSFRELNLKNNSMKEIKSSVFGNLPTLIVVDLSCNQISTISRSAFTKITSMRFLNLTHNKLESLFQIPISLNELYLRENRVQNLNVGTWPVMNSLIHLDLSNNELKDSLNSTSFEGLIVLQRLYLTRNGITKPPAESLIRLNTLQYLYMEYNNITTLEKNAFGKLPVLFELHLYNNNIHNISKKAFDGLLQLLTLNLSTNAITTMPLEAFAGLPSLIKLDLSFNNLAKLDNKTDGLLDDLWSLEELNLSHNNITYVAKRTFHPYQIVLRNLHTLDLSYNQIPVITNDIMLGGKNVAKLNLSHNYVKELRPGVLSNFTSLEIFDISHNELKNLAQEGNNLKIPINLKQLYLEGNQIYHVNFAKFLNGQNLSVIDLRNNNLTVYPLPLVRSLRKGANVRFSGNPLHCSCAARPLKYIIMEKLTLGSNTRNITCASPANVKNEYLENIKAENLLCSPSERTSYKEEEYNEQTDIKLKSVKLHNDNKYLSTEWFVTSREDIAYFTACLRNIKNEIVYQKELPYNKRSLEIPLKQAWASEILEFCVIVENSNGELGRWMNAQCMKLPILTAQSGSARSATEFNLDSILFFMYVSFHTTILLC